MNPKSYCISELASEFAISPRSIRFYEEKGLISPKRTAGNQRIYNKRDRARLKLILRGRRFGYSLEEISEMIAIPYLGGVTLMIGEYPPLHFPQAVQDKKCSAYFGVPISFH
jgi:DNA-binding transcriptional MerR regulator